VTDNLHRIFAFILEVDRLKAVLRKTKPVGVDRYENSAEHSWQLCLMAQLLVPYASGPVDVVRVVEMLLVHDIPEIDAGDQIVYQGPSEVRAEAERAGARRIFGLLPEPQAAWCLDRWEEFEARETPEAVFAYAIDRLVPTLQNLHCNGGSWRENHISLERVIAVNSAVGLACPGVWDRVHQLLREADRAGMFRHDDPPA
jgi:putative hydrolase of HD superfamily